jgi:hypothetical protein
MEIQGRVTTVEEVELAGDPEEHRALAIVAPKIKRSDPGRQAGSRQRAVLKRLQGDAPNRMSELVLQRSESANEGRIVTFWAVIS